MNTKRDSTIHRFIDDFEAHIAAILFLGLMILLTIQVISRYVFKHAFTWTEEVANICYVYIVYLGVASAVKHRKHLCIDFVVEKVSFKVKRVLLILSDIVFIVFCVLMMFPLLKILNGYKGLSGASSPLLGIPKVISFGIIPLCMVVTIIRLIQDIIRLSKEREEEIGMSKPTLDLEIFEREYKLNQDIGKGKVTK